MKIKAYLDTYQIIRVYSKETLFCDSLEIKSNGEPLAYKANYEDKYLEINLLKNIDLEAVNVLVYEGKKQEIEYREVVHCDDFINDYYPEVNTLGVRVVCGRTLFRFWAPFKDEVKLILDNKEYPMFKLSKGIWQTSFEGNYSGRRYHYEMIKNGKVDCVIDPFCIVKSKDGLDSFIIDSHRLEFEKVTPRKLNRNEIVVYETSVRDFSSIGEPFNSPKKFKALAEEGLKIGDEKIGFDYVKELGVTHIQLMPVMDFDDDKGDYNWGYNPVGYNTFKQAFIESEDPYDQINEIREVVKKYHENDLRIILDVVFNHVYKRSEFIFEKILPNLFFRFEKDHTNANGVGLGNEVMTDCPFVRDYLTLVCKRLVEIYDFDGLRYDLSGIIDVTTIQSIRNACQSIKEDVLMICEGWNMGSVLKFEDKCCHENAKNVEGHIFFNPGFRDVVKGHHDHKGFILDNLEMKKHVGDFMDCADDLDKTQSLNFLECHDNRTLYDYLKYKHPKDDEELLKKRCMLGMGIELLSKGTPFIHSGMEFLRTKNGIDNTYNKPDSINMLDWILRVKNKDVASYVKDLIGFRKANASVFEEPFDFDEYYEMLVVKTSGYVFLINPCIFDHIYRDEHQYEMIFDGQSFTSRCDEAFDVKAYSLVILKK